MQRFLSIAATVAVTLSLASPAFARSSMSSMSMPTCAAGDTVVWVNTRSKVYYMPGASYYGKTKHGKYVCASAATSMGAHAAKSGMMSDSNGSSMSGHKMMHHSAMHKMDTMHGGSMGSGSMSSGSMGSGTMKSPGTMVSTAPSTPDSRGLATAAPGASPAIQVSPIPALTASPSAH